MEARTDTCCYACGSVLTPVFEPKTYPGIPDAKFDPHTGQRLTVPQFRGSVDIMFAGGYGQYYDAIDPRIKVVICSDCMDTLRETVPWIDHIMKHARAKPNDVAPPFIDHTIDITVTQVDVGELKGLTEQNKSALRRLTLIKGEADDK